MEAQDIPEKFCSFEFWSKHWMADWVKALPETYWREMLALISQRWIRRTDYAEFLETAEGQRIIGDQLFTRMSQSAQVFVPWLAEGLELNGASILEVGCGTGSSTVGLARAGCKVFGVDISSESLETARRRIDILGLDATLTQVPNNWLSGPDFSNELFSRRFDAIVCYALFEHLLPNERLNLLDFAKSKMERDSTLLALFETPNRLAPHDWHSAKMPFADIVPDELAWEYTRRSPRADHPSRRANKKFTEVDKAALYRFGKGASFHEFELIFGINNLEVVVDGYSPQRSAAQRDYGAALDFEAALEKIFADLPVPIPRGFCRPSLDLILRLRPIPQKTPVPR